MGRGWLLAALLLVPVACEQPPEVVPSPDAASPEPGASDASAKVEADAEKFEGQIRQIVQGYAKAAVDMDHEEIQNDVRKLLDAF